MLQKLAAQSSPPRIEPASRAPSCAGSKRVALVVGNDAYVGEGISPLLNAAHDAEDLAAMLRDKLCFDVILAKNLGRDDFPAKIDEFAAKARGVEVALFYFSGHGLQYKEQNYLLPIDPKISGENALKSSAVTAQTIVAALNGRAKFTLLFLDACRSNPFQERLALALNPDRGKGATPAERGLAPMAMPADSEMLMVFATRANKTASDGTAAGRNSPFAQAMIEKFAQADEDVKLVLGDVAVRVDELTGSAQIPESYGDLRHRLKLLRGK